MRIYEEVSYSGKSTGHTIIHLDNFKDAQNLLKALQAGIDGQKLKKNTGAFRIAKKLTEEMPVY